MSAPTSCRAFLNSESVSRSGRFLSAGSSLWKHADRCQDAISADFAAPLDEIADWIRSAWRAVPSSGISSSQDLNFTLVGLVARSLHQRLRPVYYSRLPRRQFDRRQGQGVAAAFAADLFEIEPSSEMMAV